MTTLEKKDKTASWLMFGLIAFIYVALIVIEAIISPLVPTKSILNPNSILFTVLKKGAIYSLVAVSMNLLNGFTGLFSLGQAGFMLIGAYTYAVFTMPVEVKLSDTVYKYYDCVLNFDTGVLVGLICAGLAAALFAALIGLPVLKLKSDYLAIATLGFAEIIRAIFQWEVMGPITNGANQLRYFKDLGSVKLPFSTLFVEGGVKFPPTTFVFVIGGACVAIILLLINSSYGRAFKAIRDDEVAAEAMGINLFKHKELSFVISSFFAGISGALLAMYQYTINAQQFKSALTYEILLIVVIGGIGSISGSVIATFLYVAASEWWLRFLDDPAYNILGMSLLRSGFRKLVFSVIIMIIVLFFSRGLMGDKELSFKGLVDRIRKRKASKAGKGGESNG